MKSTSSSVGLSRITLVALLAAFALVIAGCGGDSTGDTTTTAAGATTTTAAGETATTAAAAAQGSGPMIFVVGGKADDPFWSKVKRGAEDAALVVQASGGDVIWLGPENYDNLGPDAATLIRNAISQNADAIVGPDWVPEAEDEAFQQAVDAGIPLIIYNSGGQAAADRLGALNYVGNEEYPAGLAAGEFFGENGYANVLCVNTLPGATNTEDRCRGVADGIAESGGASTQLPLPSSDFGDPTAVSQAVAAQLTEDATIDGIIFISAGDADAGASAIQQASAADSVALASFDMNETGIARIQSGDQLFAIDQQPYYQGYLGVSLVFGYVMYGLELPQHPILTGPAVISAANIDAVVAGVQAGTR